MGKNKVKVKKNAFLHQYLAVKMSVVFVHYVQISDIINIQLCSTHYAITTNIYAFQAKNKTEKKGSDLKRVSDICVLCFVLVFFLVLSY